MPTTFWARADSNNANNPALNPTGDPAVQINFVPSGASGDILLEYNMGNVDPDTLVEIDGTEYQFSFQLTADMPTLNRDGAQQVPDQFEGSQVLVIEVQDYPTSGEVYRMFFLPDDAATQSEMDAFGNGAIDLQNVNTTDTGIICYAKGTMILTPFGERPIENLRAGDTVITKGNGPQTILWAAYSTLCWPGRSDCEKPVKIRSGALGRGLPERNLCVSPQHRILVQDPGSGCGVFVPAKSLVDLPGVRVMQGKKHIIYYHLLLENHELITANGLQSESFYPGKQALRMLSLQRRKDLSEVCNTKGYGPLARKCLSVNKARELVKFIARSGNTFCTNGLDQVAA